MVDGVFYDGLQGDLVAQVIQAFLFRSELIMKLVLEPLRLDLQVAFRMLQFAPDGDQLVSAADTDSEQPRQSVDHLDSLRIFPLLTHPGDRVQSVIQEMRVDLDLQCFQFCFAEIDLLFPDLCHQLLEPHHHVAE